MSTTVRTHVAIHHSNAPEVRVRADVADGWQTDVQPVHLGWGVSHFQLETAPGQDIRLKPTLDGEWTQGEDIHVHAGQSVELYPVFERNKGQVVKLFEGFYSHRMGDHRDVWAYLPPGDANERCGVLALNDVEKMLKGTGKGGQSWELEKTLDAMIAEGKIPRTIALGVTTGNREDEYGDARADDYLHCLFNEVVPAAHAHLRTLVGPEHMAFLGSSMGGRSALAAGLKRPDAVRRVGAMSPTSSAFVGGEMFADSLRSGRYDPHQLDRIYVDRGDIGPGDLDDDTRPLLEALRERGVDEGSGKLQSWAEPGARHGEYYWGQRVGRALQHLLG